MLVVVAAAVVVHHLALIAAPVGQVGDVVEVVVIEALVETLQQVVLLLPLPGAALPLVLLNAVPVAFHHASVAVEVATGLVALVMVVMMMNAMMMLVG